MYYLRLLVLYLVVMAVTVVISQADSSRTGRYALILHRCCMAPMHKIPTRVRVYLSAVSIANTADHVEFTVQHAISPLLFAEPGEA
jgi:hypothetical protein